jgi:D-3-phosphoglycerate dehydrogenase
MIRILISEPLSAKAGERLNEIPEFDIVQKTDLTPEQLAAEIKNVEALVISGSAALPQALPNGCGKLKLIVCLGGRLDPAQAEAARRNRIEIRATQAPGGKLNSEAERERSGLDVIAILKDFFNV